MRAEGRGLGDPGRQLPMIEAQMGDSREDFEPRQLRRLRPGIRQRRLPARHGSEGEFSRRN
jgi:hypothetical protein